MIHEIIYNKIILVFPKKQEVIFRKKYYQDSIGHLRLALILLMLLYGAFGYLDITLFPEHASLFYKIRFLFAIPSMLFVLILSYTKIFKDIWQILLVISFLISGSGISVMIMTEPNNYVYHAGMMLIFFGGYFFIKLRFVLATVAGWGSLLIFNMIAIFYVKVPNIFLIVSNSFFISANLIGMFGSYSIEYYIRRNFSLKKNLDDEKLYIEELNDNLEKKIEERTCELIKAKERAIESDRLKSAFLANMSHEIRTPMNGILGFSELLKNPDLSGEKQQQYISIIEKSGDRMLNTINNIVDISKIESGLMEVVIEKTNVNEQIEYIYQFFKPEVEAKNMTFSFNNTLALEEVNIKTDKEKLFAILINLVKNAIKYSDEGSIEFGYHKKENILEFYVKDTGIGVPKNRQEAIFERFIQADINDKMAKQGAGLGLSISKAFVKALGGEMWLESEENVGSTFYFTLPYKIDPIEKNKKIVSVFINKNKVVKTSKMNGLTILVAEDDEISETLLSIAIESISTKILKAKTGVEAIEIFKENPSIDLILMDIQMPEMGGYEATKFIREINKDVIIIAQTAFGLAGDKEKAIESGCNDYISKPINKNDLLKLIKKYFN